MCTPGHHPRPDGLTRDVFLARMGAEVRRALEEGLPLAGYLHWTLADNYEWGSYQPRFGLYGVRRQGEQVELMDTDATGVDAPAAFKVLLSG
jgi:beta-glucosidase